MNGLFFAATGGIVTTSTTRRVAGILARPVWVWCTAHELLLANKEGIKGITTVPDSPERNKFRVVKAVVLKGF